MNNYFWFFFPLFVAQEKMLERNKKKKLLRNCKTVACYSATKMQMETERNGEAGRREIWKSGSLKSYSPRATASRQWQRGALDSREIIENKPRAEIAPRRARKRKDALTTTVLVAKVRKPPHVGEVDGKADNRQQEIELSRPRFPAVAAAAVLREIFHQRRRHLSGTCKTAEWLYVYTWAPLARWENLYFGKRSIKN